MWLNRKGWLIINYFRFFRYCPVPWSKLNQVIPSHQNFVIFSGKSQYDKFSLILSGCEWVLSSVRSLESLRCSWPSWMRVQGQEGSPGSEPVSLLFTLGKYPLLWLAWAVPNGVQAGSRECHRKGNMAAPSPWGGLGSLCEKQLARHRSEGWCN